MFPISNFSGGFHLNFSELIEKIKKKFIKSDIDAQEQHEETDAVPGKTTGNAFIDSLNKLRADDIAPESKIERDPADRRRAVIRYISMAVFGCIFLGSAASLVRSLVDYKRGDDIYGDISENIFAADLSGGRAVAFMDASKKSQPMPDYYTSLSSDMSDVPSEHETVNEEFEQMKTNLTYLKSQNPDIYGYIHIDGTHISYPIVQGEDNEYYLNRAWNGEYVVVGAIFADFQADANIENNYNTVFYGHNMRDGKMFNNVMNFLEEDVFYNTNILVYTFDGVYTFEPFSIFQTVYTYQYFRMGFADDADFVAFCEEMQGQSVHNKGMTFTGDDRIITLSTCTPSDDVSTYYIGRYALHAKLVEVSK